MDIFITNDTVANKFANSDEVDVDNVFYVLHLQIVGIFIVTNNFKYFIVLILSTIPREKIISVKYLPFCVS